MTARKDRRRAYPGIDSAQGPERLLFGVFAGFQSITILACIVGLRPIARIGVPALGSGRPCAAEGGILIERMADRNYELDFRVR